MKWWGVYLVWLLVSSACTKANPQSCADGLCTDQRYPFCDVDGTLGGESNECIAVECTPGEFAACRGDQELRCNASGNNYDVIECERGCNEPTGCETCTTHEQCTAGICKPDGVCASESEIAYVGATGSPSSQCTKDAPCTLVRALEIPAPPSGQFIRIAAGTYKTSGAFVINGRRTLVGAGSGTTYLKGTMEGSVVLIGVGAVARLERLRVTEGVFAGTFGTGKGVECPAMPLGPRNLTMIDTDVSSNAGAGVFAEGCSVELVRSTFNDNYSGAEITNGNLSVDRSSFFRNSAFGLFISGAADCAVTNSFMIRNQAGAFVNPCTNSTTFAFNTIVDNTAYGLSCTSPSAGPQLSVPNNIIARNQTNVRNDGGLQCTLAGSIVSVDVTALRFKSTEFEPYDYHLTAGSIAIDAASVSGLGHDYDGDARPAGGVPDVGADEFVP